METSVDVGSDERWGAAVNIDSLAWYLNTVVTQLAAGGVTQAVVCPGSRSTPLTLALHHHAGIKVHVLVDERSAGFFALGLAKALKQPVAIVVTSGTAAANLLPAVVEASLSHVPLIVLTADRPRELRGVGASQTIDQVELYGSHVKFFKDLPSPEATIEVIRYVRSQVARALQCAGDMRPGPVHLNFPFREPLLPKWSHTGIPVPPSPITHPILTVSQRSLANAKAYLGQFSRGIVVVGQETEEIPADLLLSWANRWGWPVFADILANMRHIPGVIGSYDLLLKHHPAPAPDVVIRIGAIPTSKSLNQLIHGLPGLLLEPAPQGLDPNSQDLVLLGGDISESLTALLDPPASYRGDPQWISQWQETHRRVTAALPKILTQQPPNAEPQLFGNLDQWLSTHQPHPLPVMVSNSMPVRDLDTYLPTGSRHLRFFANRGANGIDGVTSTALGLSSHFGDVVLIIGDLAFYHDMNGLLAALKFGLNALIIVINNHGGGIFSFLPQHEQLAPDVFEAYFGTPLDLDLSHAASLYHAEFRRATSTSDLKQYLEDLQPLRGLRILEWIVPSREENRRWHLDTAQRIGEVLSHGHI